MLFYEEWTTAEVDLRGHRGLEMTSVGFNFRYFQTISTETRNSTRNIDLFLSVLLIITCTLYKETFLEQVAKGQS